MNLFQTVKIRASSTTQKNGITAIEFVNYKVFEIVYHDVINEYCTSTHLHLIVVIIEGYY